MLNDGNLTLTFSAYNRSLILHYWMKVTVLCYSLLNYWLLLGVNAHMLVHNLTRHCQWQFVNDGQSFICYSSRTMILLMTIGQDCSGFPFNVATKSCTPHQKVTDLPLCNWHWQWLRRSFGYVRSMEELKY